MVLVSLNSFAKEELDFMNAVSRTARIKHHTVKVENRTVKAEHHTAGAQHRTVKAEPHTAGAERHIVKAEPHTAGVESHIVIPKHRIDLVAFHKCYYHKDLFQNLVSLFKPSHMDLHMKTRSVTFAAKHHLNMMLLFEPYLQLLLSPSPTRASSLQVLAKLNQLRDHM